MLKIAAAVAAGLAVPAAATASTTLIYDTHRNATELARSAGGNYCAADVLRLNRAERTADGPTCATYVPRLKAADLVGRDAPGMAATLRAAIDSVSGDGRASHLVAIDEIGNEFRDPRPRVRHRLVTLGGRTFRIAAHHEIKRRPKGGWYVVRKPAPPSPAPGPSHPGSRLSRAMQILADTPSPWGGSYASRVHFYAAPAYTTAIAAGSGPHFTLNKARTKEVRPGWRAVSPALARAGGVWLAMYHGDGTALDARSWRLGPARIARYMERLGGDAGRVHFVIGGLVNPPPGVTGCSSPMSCHWALARSPRNAPILANGVGAWRLGEQVGEFAANHAAVFG